MAGAGLYSALIHKAAKALPLAWRVASVEFGGMPLRRMRQKWLAGFMPHGWIYACAAPVFRLAESRFAGICKEMAAHVFMAWGRNQRRPINSIF